MTPLIYVNKCGSTNEEIITFLDAEAHQMVSLYTFNQTKGKGQYGNSWESGENRNLAFTTAVPANLIQLPDYLLNFHTAVLAADFLAILTKTPVEIKWPNDLILRNKKVSGILLEKRTVKDVPYFILGVGINILQEDFLHLPKAGSLRTQTGFGFQPKKVAEAFHKYLATHLTAKIEEGDVLARLNQNLFRKDLVSVFEIKASRQNGIIKRVDTRGFLCVDLENEGLKKFYHKEIDLLY